jgi:hypothetical protein
MVLAPQTQTITAALLSIPGQITNQDCQHPLRRAHSQAKLRLDMSPFDTRIRHNGVARGNLKFLGHSSWH